MKKRRYRGDRNWWYRRVVKFLAGCPRRAAYAGTICRALRGETWEDSNFDWINSLLREMRQAGLVWYCPGSGWKLRRGAEERVGLTGGDQ